VSATNQEQYRYDATGNRVLRRTTNGSGTTLMVYAFGREEHQYSATGTNLWNTYYYFLGSRLIGDLDANGTYFLLTDAPGSILSDISWSAGGASIKANQVFGPYGNARAGQGTFNTAKGFTGQYNDGLTGLDYYISRYYDPVAGVFLSADQTQGNMQGMDPYSYVGGNPETKSDPTGQAYINQQDGKYVPPPPPPPPPPQTECNFWCVFQNTFHLASTNNVGELSSQVHGIQAGLSILDFFTGASSIVGDVQTVFSGDASIGQKALAVGDFSLNVGMDALMLTGAGELLRGGDLAAKGGLDIAEQVSKKEVLLDTNMVFQYRKVVERGLIDLSAEEPIITQTTLGELNDVTSRPGSFLKYPAVADSLRVVEDAASNGTKDALLEFMNSLGPVKQQGLQQDLIIAATAIDTGRPLITGEKVMSRAIQAIAPDFDLRFFVP